MIGPSARELAEMQRENIKAMPDVATILRLPANPARSATGGFAQDFEPHGTTPCRFTASVLAGGSEQVEAGQSVGTMGYTMSVPADTDIRPADRIQLAGSVFEVLSGKKGASWNMSDAWSLVEIQR